LTEKPEGEDGCVEETPLKTANLSATQPSPLLGKSDVGRAKGATHKATHRFPGCQKVGGPFRSQCKL